MLMTFPVNIDAYIDRYIDPQDASLNIDHISGVGEGGCRAWGVGGGGVVGVKGASGLEGGFVLRV